jgi:hypothetical protein
MVRCVVLPCVHSGMQRLLKYGPLLSQVLKYTKESNTTQRDLVQRAIVSVDVRSLLQEELIVQFLCLTIVDIMSTSGHVILQRR